MVEEAYSLVGAFAQLLKLGPQVDWSRIWGEGFQGQLAVPATRKAKKASGIFQRRAIRYPVWIWSSAFLVRAPIR